MDKLEMRDTNLEKSSSATKVVKLRADINQTKAEVKELQEKELNILDAPVHAQECGDSDRDLYNESTRRHQSLREQRQDTKGGGREDRRGSSEATTQTIEGPAS
ncbi:hypothetical protein HAX54_047180 [Datura stramonium]|uniref:Uncharacterized protein n=1 Tax=Datura stramonium TaxID=4076 RepID=A0ABS8SSG8_DATST|nr:hypothetical protein [Datura stramonium]